MNMDLPLHVALDGKSNVYHMVNQPSCFFSPFQRSWLRTICYPDSQQKRPTYPKPKQLSFQWMCSALTESLQHKILTAVAALRQSNGPVWPVSQVVGGQDRLYSGTMQVQNMGMSIPGDATHRFLGVRAGILISHISKCCIGLRWAFLTEHPANLPNPANLPTLSGKALLPTTNAKGVHM